MHRDNSVLELTVYLLEGIKFRYIITADTLCTQVKVSKLSQLRKSSRDVFESFRFSNPLFQISCSPYNYMD